MIKKALWILMIVAVLSGGWYFLIKPHHLSVAFTASQPSEIVYRHLLEWEVVAGDSLRIMLAEKSRPTMVEQTVKRDNSRYRYRWSIKRQDTARTRVKASITDLDNPWGQKWRLLFGASDLKSWSKAQVMAVYNGLKNKEAMYRVHKIKDSLREPVHCAYIPLRSTISGKAAAMRANITAIMPYLRANNIPLSGNPFLEITHWDRRTDSIWFDFCFPVQRQDSFPSSREVRFKTTNRIKGLKAEFNGNYRDSYNAWFHLLDVAEKRKGRYAARPVEVFLNDPQGAGDPLKWKAIIYLPLEEK